MLRLLIESDPDVVAGPMAQLIEAGGKRLRPALVLLVARLGDADPAALAEAAVAVELVHAATLVHDDVIDRSPLRRGRPTIAAQLGSEPAIVIGDYYFAKAYERAAATESPRVVAILARAVMAICAGEVRQQAIRYRYSTDVDEYMERIYAKTATLLAACCEIGAVLGGLDDESLAAVFEYGWRLGLAFQIADDVLDYVASEDEVGKPIGHDLAEGFATLPLMLAVDDPVAGPKIKPVLVDGRELTPAKAKQIAALVRESDAPRLAIDQARKLAAQAHERLDVLLDNEVTRALASLTEYVVSRTF